MKRLFVALLLGEDRGRRLGARVADALGGRAERDHRLLLPEGLHLTLFFLGDTAPERVPALGEALRGTLDGLPAPRLRLGRAGAFPDRGPARVLWVGIDEAEEAGRLAAVQRAVLDGLEGTGVDTSEERERPFRPHVTVARPRRRERAPASFLALDAGGEAWTPEAVHLVESVTGDGPARYEPLVAFPLRR